MRLLYIGKYLFLKTNGKTFALPAYGEKFWDKFLDVFEGINILGENMKGYLNNGTFSELKDPRIQVDILPSNTSPKDFINDKKIKKILKYHISRADAILIKPSSRKGIMAIKIAKKFKKPYMIDITGDLNLTLRSNGSLLKRIYGPILHKQIIAAIKDCNFGLYVTEKYLQKTYPIVGKQCGCTDTFILDPDETVFEHRISKIDAIRDDSEISIGMVASYHDNRKGLDTALEALGMLENKKIKLHILGLGTEEDRNKWITYAKECGIENQLIFDPSLSGVENVLKWNDNIDIIILPSRSEGLPRCIVESLSRACPCIISNVCGMPELVEEKWLHDPGDSEKLAMLIKDMLSDKEIMKRTAKINFEKSKDFEFEKLRQKRNMFLLEFKDYCEKCNKES